jgi:hypothetical protein
MPGAGVQVEELFALKLNPAFAGTPKGRRLAAIFDQRMPQLLYSGKLRELYGKWGAALPARARQSDKADAEALVNSCRPRTCTSNAWTISQSG